MKFKDLKLGMKCQLTSEDDTDLVSVGCINDIWTNEKSGNVCVQFDDIYGTFTYGRPDEELHSFIKFIGYNDMFHLEYTHDNITFDVYYKADDNQSVSDIELKEVSLKGDVTDLQDVLSSVIIENIIDRCFEDCKNG